MMKSKSLKKGMGMDNKLIIFDWDWTLARGENTTPEKPFRKRGDRYEWMRPDMPGILEWLHAENSLAIATNQGGIAFGFQNWDETEHAIFTLLKELSFPIPLLICPYHEQRPLNFGAYATWRKPKTGMLLTICHLFPLIVHGDVVVVGDRPEDEEAANHAEFEYHAADAFFAMVAEEIRDMADDEQAEAYGLPPTGEVLSPEERAMIDGDEDEDEPPF